MGKRRLSHIELAYKADSIKTFDNEVYELKGTVAVNPNNGDIKKIADVYYRVRTAINEEKNVIAKRKHCNDELLTNRKLD